MHAIIIDIFCDWFIMVYYFQIPKKPFQDWAQEWKALPEEEEERYRELAKEARKNLAEHDPVKLRRHLRSVIEKAVSMSLM